MNHAASTPAPESGRDRPTLADRIHATLRAREAAPEAVIGFGGGSAMDPGPEAAAQYPHQVSGRQLQRVMIAVELAPKPDVLIADEPTTALDVTVQAQILALPEAPQAETGMGLLVITDDLGGCATSPTGWW